MNTSPAPGPQRRHSVLRLNTFSAAAWAVVVTLTGAIVTDGSNRLVMKLSREDADRIAAELDGLPWEEPAARATRS